MDEDCDTFKLVSEQQAPWSHGDTRKHGGGTTRDEFVRAVGLVKSGWMHRCWNTGSLYDSAWCVATHPALVSIAESSYPAVKSSPELAGDSAIKHVRP